jgi:hypothetical protein
VISYAGDDLNIGKYFSIAYLMVRIHRSQLIEASHIPSLILCRPAKFISHPDLIHTASLIFIQVI